MKQIKVNEKCSGCGMCVMNSAYLQENDEGNAQPVMGMAIKDEDMEQIQQVINECPEGALEIIETRSTTKTGKAGINDIIADLRKKCESLSVQRIKHTDVKLDSQRGSMELPTSCNNEFEYIYSSESAARSAARDEFRRLCYSESVYQPILKKVFVDYKVNVLKPYYNCNDEADSAYYPYNEMVRKYLADAYAEICELVGNSMVPENWKNFSVYLEEIWVDALIYFDIRSTSSGIMEEFKDIPGANIDDYVNHYIDYDSFDDYVGESLFGKPKYKEVWRFSGFFEAVKEFEKDLRSAIKYASSNIEENAANCVNQSLEKFETELKEAFNAKIEELERYVK